MREKTKIKRPAKSVQLSIRLEPKIHEALIDVGDRVGVKPAVLAGMAIGDYVTRSQASYGAAANTQEMMAKEMAAVIGSHVNGMITTEAFEKMASDDG